jgi:hypothetical protein
MVVAMLAAMFAPPTYGTKPVVHSDETTRRREEVERQRANAGYLAVIGTITQQQKEQQYLDRYFAWIRFLSENGYISTTEYTALREGAAHGYIRMPSYVATPPESVQSPYGGDQPAPPVTAASSEKGGALPPGAVNAKGQLALPAYGTADLGYDKAGNLIDRNLRRAQNKKGTNQERGAAGKEYVEGVSGEVGGERKSRSVLGYRQQDISEAIPRTQTDFRREVKNYKLYLTDEGGQRVENAVPLSDELLGQALRDAAWIAEGAAIGEHRVVQWDFVGAPPRADLAAFLNALHLPYQVHR